MKTGFFLLIFMLSCYAKSASFDCNKAYTNVEKLICIDSILSKQDEQLDQLYSDVLSKMDDKKSFRNTQRKWLKEKRNVCENAMCLMQAYHERIAQLNSLNKVMPSRVEHGMPALAPAETTDGNQKQ